MPAQNLDGGNCDVDVNLVHVKMQIEKKNLKSKTWKVSMNVRMLNFNVIKNQLNT